MPPSKTIQTAFDSGKYSARMDGRVDVEGYRNACKRLENFIVFPQGGAITRSGSKYIAGAKSNSLASRLIPFVISTVSAYVIEVGNTYMRFYKAGAQLLDTGSPVEIVTPYLTAELFELDFAQTNDVMYITHINHAPRKLSRISDTEWVLHEVNFDTEPLILDNFTISDAITLQRITGPTAFEKDKTTKFTDSTNINFKFLDGDIGRVLFAGERRAKILWAASVTTSQDAFAKIIDQFLDSDSSFSADELTMVGTPFGSLNPSAAGAVGDIITLTSNVDGTSASSLINSSNRWLASSVVANAYYFNVNPTTDPTEGLAWHGDFLKKVTSPSDIASAGQWSYGDEDSLAFNTIYIRTPLDTDPDSLWDTQNQNALLRIDEGSKGKDVSAENTFVRDLTFSVDGSKMYIIGINTGAAFQYTLSTPWDVSTAVYASKSVDVTGQETSPKGISFKIDGLIMYIVGTVNGTVYQYTLSTPWDISTATFASKSKDVTPEDTDPQGLTFSVDGTKMYISGATNDTVFQYTVSTPWDISTASFASKIKDVSAEDTDPLGVVFKPDGLIMYIVGVQNNTVYQYTLGAAWDVSTASFASKSKDVSPQEGTPSGVSFSSDGTKMYISGADDIIYQYTVVTPWDVSTASFTTGSPANLFRKEDEGKFIQINSGLVLITTFIDNTSVQGRVLQALDSADATTVWTMLTSFWDDADNPGAVVFHENRLVYGGSPSFPNSFWGSEVNEYEKFQPGTADGDSYTFTLNARKSSFIRWLESRDVMIAGLEDSEWQIGLRDGIITPSSIFTRRRTIHGCANIQSIVAEQSILFVERGGDKVRELNFNFESDDYIAADKTLLAEDVGGSSGFKQIDVQNRPFPVVWAVNNDGELAGMTYIRDQNLSAWHAHKTGATALGVSDGSDSYESVAVIPNLADETVDEVWVIVKRTINGATVRFVERFEKPLDKDAVPTDARMLDAFTLQETTSTTVSGLDRFDGDTVTAIRDGDPDKISTHVVAGGEITITAPVTNVVVGLPYKPLIQTMRPAVPGPTGTSQAEIARISKVWLRLFNTLGLKCGATEAGVTALNLEKSSQVNEDDYYTFADNGLFEGDVEFQDYAGGNNLQNFVFIVQDLPLPATITALIMEVDTT